MSEHEFRNDNGYMVRVFDLGGGITRVNEHRSVTDTRTFYVIDGFETRAYFNVKDLAALVAHTESY